MICSYQRPSFSLGLIFKKIQITEISQEQYLCYERLVKMWLPFLLVYFRNVPLRVTIAMQTAIETVNIKDDLEVDTLQKHFSHSK